MFKLNLKLFLITVMVMFLSGFGYLKYQILYPIEACNETENVQLGIGIMFKDLLPMLMLYDKEGYQGIENIKGTLEDSYRDSYLYLLHSFKQQNKIDVKMKSFSDSIEDPRIFNEVRNKLYSDPASLKMILDVARGFFYHELKNIQQMYTKEINEDLTLKNPVEKAIRLFFHLDIFGSYVEKPFLLKYITNLNHFNIQKNQEKNVQIAIPSNNCTPEDVIKNSYDSLAAYMDPQQAFFMGLSTFNSDLAPHKLIFNNEKYGFEFNEAYRIWISFYPNEQNLMNFSFSPFEITHPKPESEVKEIADDWVDFFESLGWEKRKSVPNIPYGTMPKSGCWPYQVWESDGMAQSVNICVNEFKEDKSIPKYFIKIVFESNPNRKI